jgi:hypothetical protein
MHEPIAFKSGKDLAMEARVASTDTVTCVACDRVETDEQAYEERWQLDPAVCPDCLYWTLTDAGEACCAGGVS